jgi:amidase
LTAGDGAVERSRDTIRAAAQAYRAATRSYDIVLTPTMASEPWRAGHLSPIVPEAVLRARVAECMAYTPIQNVVGAPAMSVPLVESERGLPIGMHFAAAPGNDALLLALAYQLEAAYPWQDRWPPYSIPALDHRAPLGVAAF